MAQEKSSFNEPEENNDEPIITNHSEEDDFDNPLGNPVIEKNYTRPNVNVDPSQLFQQIPEPPINAEMIDLTKPKPSAAPPPPPEQPKEHQPYNPQMGQLPKKDKRDAAERAADAVLDGYGFLKAKANYFLKINDGQLKRLQKQGKINLTIPVPYDEYGNVITLEQYIQEFNKQNEDNMVFEQEDRDAIRPVMVKYFEEQGIGMTVRDELIYLGIKELITFGAQVWQGLAIKKEMVKNIIELTQSYNNRQAPPMYSTAPPPPPPPPPAQTNTSDTGNMDNNNNNSNQDYVEIITDGPKVEIPIDDIPLAMQGANAAALKMVGAIPDSNEVPKKKKGRPTRAEQEKLRQEKLQNG
jgi:hypothetical protein